MNNTLKCYRIQEKKVKNFTILYRTTTEIIAYILLNQFLRKNKSIFIYYRNRYSKI